ncbi:hypothetical protein NMY22_g7474 [Coprinellus aureogranulatus]|nr:hypothetical protein NMY22_g7474 [Coprinellus aureogranulatus]
MATNDQIQQAFNAALDTIADSLRTAANGVANQAGGYTAAVGGTIAQLTIGTMAVILAAALRMVFKPLIDGIINALTMLWDGQEKGRETAIERNKKLQEQTEALKAQNDTLQVALANIVSTQNEANKLGQKRANLAKIKPEAPETFDGNPERVMPFLTACTIYFTATQEENPPAQIAYALSKIKGGKDNSATRWADGKREELCKYMEERHEAVKAGQNDKVAELDKEQPGWDKFIEVFKQHFMLNGSKEMAQQFLMALTMGNNTCEEYTTMFNGYQTTAGFDEVYLQIRYKDGLTKGLRSKVVASYPPPKNLKEWKERALLLDKEWRKENQKGISASVHAPKKEKKEEKDPNAMEIDAISTEKKDTRKCYQCNEIGHIAWQCPQKAEGSQPRGNGNPRGRGFSFGQRGGRGSYPSRQINAAQVEKTELEKLKEHIDSLIEQDQESLEKMFQRPAGF